MPNAQTFRTSLTEIFKEVSKYPIHEVTIISGELHRKIGGYPGIASNHRMSECCRVMKQLMNEDDEIVSQPPRGQGATLTIRYKLPRQ